MQMTMRSHNLQSFPEEMPINIASQVEVQAPPGLESVSGCGLSAASTIHPESPKEVVTGPAAASGPRTEQELKETIVREVTEAVRDHVEWKTAAAVETLWQRGQRAMQRMQQQQASQTEKLQAQLATCADSYMKLERENAALRSSLEALMKHLTVVLGPPPHCVPPPSPGPSPFFPPQEQQGSTPAASSQVANQGGTVAQPTSQSEETEQFHTPAVSPAVSPSDQTSVAVVPPPEAGITESPPKSAVGAAIFESVHGTAPDLPSFPAVAEEEDVPTAPSAVGTTVSSVTQLATTALSQGAESLEVSAAPPAPAFTLTLRRADNVPLGLDVRGETGEPCLMVDAVRPGGAVEAWNRQCAGDTREIRPGDRIIMINSAKDADAMREECLTKHLLRMTVFRGPNPAVPGISTSSAEPVTAAVTQRMGGGGLRAEADEFVPQAGASWP